MKVGNLRQAGEAKVVKKLLGQVQYTMTDRHEFSLCISQVKFIDLAELLPLNDVERRLLCVRLNFFSSPADGLVSYSSPAGEEMTFDGQQVYLNDSVYDGAMGYR